MHISAHQLLKYFFGFKNLACSHLNLGAGEQLKDSLVRYYIALAGENRKLSKSIKKHSDSDFAKGSSYRLSLKINESIYQQFVNLMKETRLNKTQLLKGLILQINEDVLQNPTNKRIHELERLMLAAA